MRAVLNLIVVISWVSDGFAYSIYPYLFRPQTWSFHVVVKKLYIEWSKKNEIARVYLEYGCS